MTAVITWMSISGSLLTKTKSMITFFQLHDAVELIELEEKWSRMFQLPWKQHVDAV
jgi:hypothetical protein